MEQTKYNDQPSIVAANEPHMACLLLLDVSGSMGFSTPTGKRPIDQLNSALNRFKEDVCKDSRTRDILEVCIIEFDHEARLVQDWGPVENMGEVTLQVRGGTAFVPAVKMALEKIDERVKFYKQVLGPNFYKPWIVMITDGANEHGDPVDEIAKETVRLDAEGKLRFWALGVDNYDPTDLFKLTGGPRVLELKEQDFTGFFDWLAKSMRAVSVSSPDDKPALPDLNPNVDKKVEGWA